MPRSTSSSSSSDPQTILRDTKHESPKETDLVDAPELLNAEGTPSRNWWWRYKQILREPAAEFAGVMILIIFGNGVDCQVVLSSNPGVAVSPKGDYLSLNFGWAIGTALGVWVSAGISGGHINPAITLALATWRGFPWKKVPGYIFGQLMGGVVGAALVYANYFHAIDIYEGGRGIRTLTTASLFSTYGVPTAVLVIMVFAFIDPGNSPPPQGLLPLTLFFLILGIGAALGMQTGNSFSAFCKHNLILKR
ncbi:hypothetical protein H0H92_011702 [Tricholoma furcatifolium]|nr:hypothetical protein H0H92_011702 [Tricholoma furcatifolium]